MPSECSSSSREAPPADADLLELLLSVGTQLGRVVERERSEEARLRTLIDNMPADVYLRDLDGRFLLVNRQYEDSGACGTTRSAARPCRRPI